jgi:hypothetical protein
MLAPPYDVISQQLGELFTGTKKGEYFRVRTPYLYPDGDVIDIFCQQQDDVITLTDLGETLGWLNMQTVSQKRSKKQQRLIDDVCLTYNIELHRGMLMSRVKPADNFAAALNHLAQAALRVSDVWFTLRNSTYESINMLRECPRFIGVGMIRKANSVKPAIGLIRPNNRGNPPKLIIRVV